MAALIELQNPRKYVLREERLIRAARAALDQDPGHAGAGMTIVISCGETLRELNLRHRQVNAPTDVLSFAASPLPEDIDRERSYLGDTLIAYDYAARRAKESGACLEDSLCLLVIHGALHLLGYEHDTAEARGQMWIAQARALEALGICRSIVDWYGAVEHG